MLTWERHRLETQTTFAGIPVRCSVRRRNSTGGVSEPGFIDGVRLMFHTSEPVRLLLSSRPIRIDRQAKQTWVMSRIVGLGIDMVSRLLVVMSYPTGRRIGVGLGAGML